MVASEDAASVQVSFASLVRALGLLRPDTTPCGQPMSITTAHAIGELHAAGPLTQQDLADRLRLQKSTVSRLVDEMCAGDLAARSKNPADQRSVLVDLTPHGRVRAERLEEARRQKFTGLLSQLTADECRVVVAGLGLLEGAVSATT